MHNLKLYHTPLSPFSRKIRLVLAEKKQEVELIDERFWEGRTDFLMMNPAGKVPVLKDGRVVIAESAAIFEYLEERYPNPPLLPGHPEKRAEARRLQYYFDDKFHSEVTSKLLYERIYKKMTKSGFPDSDRIKAGTKAIKFHLGYMEWLLEERRWLAGDQMTIADFTAAAHFSSLDYIGDIDWKIIPNVQGWYAKIKSRPAFRSILSDLVSGFRPSPHYTDLDF